MNSRYASAGGRNHPTGGSDTGARGQPDGYFGIRRRTVIQEMKACQQKQRALGMELAELDRMLGLDNSESND